MSKPDATAAPPAESGGTSGSFDVTPLVVTLVLLLVLVPTVVYGFHYLKKRRTAKNRSLKAGNVSGMDSAAYDFASGFMVTVKWSSNQMMVSSRQGCVGFDSTLLRYNPAQAARRIRHSGDPLLRVPMTS